MICSNCSGDFDSYNEDHGLCYDCLCDKKNEYPDDGDICGICGGMIIYLYTWEYESHYKCNGCGHEWCYD